MTILRGIPALIALMGIIDGYGATASTAESAKINPNSETCQRVAARVAAETEVPLNVLLSISLTETGRQKNGTFKPWPWTINMEGKGTWFDSRAEAFAYVSKHFKNGARSFDVGCFQINYKWHGQHFDTLEDMFDPLTNARYAARHLAELFAEKGSWLEAAGAYHSRTPKYANRYKKRFSRILASLDETFVVEFAAKPQPDSRNNQFPLLIEAGEKPSAGSLFPSRAQGGASLLISPSGGLF